MMKKSLILSVLILLISIIGCTDKEQEVFNREEALTKLSNHEFFIDDDIFDKSAEEITEIMYPNQKLNTDLLVDEEQTSTQNAFNEIKLPQQLNFPLNAIRVKDIIVILDETEYEIQHDLYLWDPLKDNLQQLNLGIQEDFLIVEFVASSDYIYWIESDLDYENKDPNWRIRSYHLTTETIKEIDNSNNYEQISLIPRLNADQSKLTYTIGEQIGENYNHYVIMYDPELEQRTPIFNIENVITPYSNAFVNKDVIAFPEYFKEGWFLLIYDIKKDKITKESLPLLTEGEFLRSFYMKDEFIIYSSSLNVLYTINADTGEQNIISNRFSDGQILGNHFFFEELGEVWSYDLYKNKKENIYQSDDLWISSLDLNNNILSSTVMHTNKSNTFYYLEYD